VSDCRALLVVSKLPSSLLALQREKVFGLLTPFALPDTFSVFFLCRIKAADECAA